MATRTVNGDRATIGARTLRKDRWWLQPLVTVTVLGLFVIYGTWVAFVQRAYLVPPPPGHGDGPWPVRHLRHLGPLRQPRLLGRPVPVAVLLAVPGRQLPGAD